MTSRILRASIMVPAMLISGCASVPLESVELSEEVAVGISAIHQSNVYFVDQYFDSKKKQVDEYEKVTVKVFFDKIIDATQNADAPALDADALNAIREKVDDIHEQSNAYKTAIDAAKEAVVNALQQEYSAVINANQSVTRMLQSAVDVSAAKNESMQRLKALGNGKIDLTNIEATMDAYMANVATGTAMATGLIVNTQALITEEGER